MALKAQSREAFKTANYHKSASSLVQAGRKEWPCSHWATAAPPLSNTAQLRRSLLAQDKRMLVVAGLWKLSIVAEGAPRGKGHNCPDERRMRRCHGLIIN